MQKKGTKHKLVSSRQSSASKVSNPNLCSRKTPQFSKYKFDINPYHKNLNEHLDSVYNKTLGVTVISTSQIPIYEKMCDSINSILQTCTNAHQRKRSLLIIIKLCSLRYAFIKKFDCKIISLLIQFIEEVPQNSCVNILDQLTTLEINHANQKSEDRFSLSKKKGSSELFILQYLSKTIVHGTNINQLFKKLKDYKYNMVLWKIIELFMKTAGAMQNYTKHYDFMLRMLSFLDKNEVPNFFQREKVIDYIYNLIDIYISYTTQGSAKQKQECQNREIPLFRVALLSIIGKQKGIFNEVMSKLYVAEKNDNFHYFFLFEFLQTFSTQLHAQQENKVKRHSYQQDRMAKKQHDMTDRFLVLIQYHKFIEKILKMLQVASTKALNQQDEQFYEDFVEPHIQNAYKLAIFLQTFRIKQHLQETIVKMNRRLESASCGSIDSKGLRMDIRTNINMDQESTVSNIQNKVTGYDFQKCDYIIYQIHFQIENVLLKSRLTYYQQVFLESPGTFQTSFFQKVLKGQDFQTSAIFTAQLTNNLINTTLTPYYLRAYLQVYIFEYCLAHYRYKNQCLVKFFEQLSPQSFIKLSADLYKDSFSEEISQCQIPKSLQAEDMYSQLSSTGMANLYFYVDKFFQNPQEIIKWGYILKVNKRSNQLFYKLKFYFGYLHDCFEQIPNQKNAVCHILRDNLQNGIKNNDIHKCSFSIALLYLLNFKKNINTSLIRILIELFLKYKQKILSMYDIQIKIQAQTIVQMRINIDDNNTNLKCLELQKRMFNIMIRTFIKLFQISGEQVANYIPRCIEYEGLIQQLVRLSTNLTPDLCVLGTVRRLSGQSSKNIFTNLLYRSFHKNTPDIREQDLLVFRQMLYAVTYTNEIYTLQYSKLEYIKKIAIIAIAILQSKCLDSCDKKFLRQKILSIQILKIVRNLTVKATIYQNELKQFFKKEMESNIKETLCRIVYKHQQLLTKYQLQLICYLRIVTLEWIIQQIQQPLDLRKKGFEIMTTDEFTQLLSYLVFDQNYDIRVYVISRILGKQFGYHITVPDRNYLPILTASAVKQPVQQLKEFVTIRIKKIDSNQTELILFYIMSFLKFLVNSAEKFGCYDQTLEQGLKLWIKTRQIEVALLAFICQSEKLNKKFCKKHNISIVSHIDMYRSYRKPVSIPVQIEQQRYQQLDESQLMFRKVKRLIYQRQGPSVQQIKIAHTIFIDWKLIEDLNIYARQ